MMEIFIIPLLYFRVNNIESKQNKTKQSEVNDKINEHNPREEE